MAHKLGYLLYACTGIFLLLLGLAWSGKAVGPTASTDTRSRTDREQPILALTFDDGPHPVYTPQLLDGLEKRDVKVSFFLMGKNIMGNEAIVKRMHEDGHLIGNHTYNHVQLTRLSGQKACEEIDETNTMLEEICGSRIVYIRPPFGSWPKNLSSLTDMQVVLWSVDPLDWKRQDTEAVVQAVLKNVKDGDIILLHDVYKTSVEAALQIIDRLTEEGYEFARIDELLLD